MPDALHHAMMFHVVSVLGTMPVLTQLDVGIHELISSFGEPGEAVARLILAAVLGGMIGLEREIQGHEAGLRTFMLVAAGSALAMIVSIAFADWEGAVPAGSGASLQIDPARIAYSVMTGVGFLGAGTILRRGSRVKGLTTAAGIWSVAALGLAVGYGLYVVSILATVLMLLTLVALACVQPWIPVLHSRRIHIEMPADPQGPDELRRFLREHGMQVRRLILEKGGKQTILIDAHVEYYRSSRIHLLTQSLLTHPRWVLVRIQL